MMIRRESVLDWSVAGVAGAAALWCAALLFPGSLVAPTASATAASLFVLVTMRLLGAAPRNYAETIVPAFPASDELLLDEILDEEDVLALEVEAPLPVADTQARIASAFDALPAARHDRSPENAPEIEDDNRVVALFGGERRAPSPAELKARIDAHLAGDVQPKPLVPLPPDASEALSAALQSLRKPE